MTFYAIWPLPACVALLVGVAATPLFRSADAPPIAEKRRVTTLDGLRGFLALAVVFHHLAVYHVFLQSGVWTNPPTFFYERLGPLGVSLFFMITGFLFWGQLLRAGGRPDWRRLYTGRVFRIGPLYLLAVLAMFALVLRGTGVHVREPAGALVGHIASWLCLGAFVETPLNGYAEPRYLLAGVTWTLRCEWAFYASLPLLALFARPARHLRAVLVALGVTLVLLHLRAVGGESRDLLARAVLFEMGMLSASLLHAGRSVAVGRSLGSAVVVVLVAAFLTVQSPRLVLNGYLLLGPAFYLIVCGADLFGLLRCRPALRLGDISYGLYLLQGLALAAVLRPARALVLGSPVAHWALGLVAALLLLGMAAAAHAYVELPGIALGQRVARRLQRTPDAVHAG